MINKEDILAWINQQEEEATELSLAYVTEKDMQGFFSVAGGLVILNRLRKLINGRPS